MDKQDVMNALKRAKESSSKRNFKQSIDLIMTVKDLDLKKPEHQIDLFTTLNHPNGRKLKICGLVGGELADQAKKELDFTVLADEFDAYGKDKKKVKKLASEYAFFIAQANLMTKIAGSFGRVFGPKNKMPNPKSGAVVGPNANLAVLRDKLRNTVRVLIKTSPQFQVCVGKEDMSEDHVVDNIMTLYNQLIHNLPNEEQNVKSIMVKLTMGPAVKVTTAKTEVQENKKGKRK